MTCDESLYRQYLSGDDEGLNALMKKYGDPLTLYIDGYLHDVHEAEELMLDVFAYLFTKKPRIRDGGFKAYLYKAARHMALRHKSKRKPLFSLDDAARGFSYRADAPLDMRMSQEGETAADLVNSESREELARILRDYGEEPFAWQIAGRIVEARETAPIETTLQLADIVASAMPPAERRKNKNPSRRTFQALRIAVNHELDALEEGLDTIFAHLAPGGRLCVITFHSLEDRLVKNKFRRWSTACTCPPEFPVCVCGGKAKAKLITRKPIEANTQELEENRRSRSAHLRVLEKI